MLDPASPVSAPDSTAPAVAGEPSLAESAEISTRVIEIFVSIVKMLGIPKSVAEIYGLLFVTAEPLPLDEIVARLRISKGSVSQGLKILRSFGGVKSAYVTGDRRDHYVAETELKKLVAGFVRGEILPRLESGGDRLQQVQALAETLPSEASFLVNRVGKLQQWHARSQAFLPLVNAMLDQEDPSV